jgi:hypothetical protein
VLDILLIEDLGQLEFSQVREAVSRVFHERATHDLPTVFTLPSGWPAELESLAVDLSLPTQSAGDIERRFQRFLATLA